MICARWLWCSNPDCRRACEDICIDFSRARLITPHCSEKNLERRWLQKELLITHLINLILWFSLAISVASCAGDPPAEASNPTGSCPVDAAVRCDSPGCLQSALAKCDPDFISRIRSGESDYQRLLDECLVAHYAQTSAANEQGPARAYCIQRATLEVLGHK